jgi:hypothetical protein
MLETRKVKMGNSQMENRDISDRLDKMETVFNTRLTSVETEVHRFNATIKLVFGAGVIIAAILIAIFTFVFNRVETMFEGYVEIRTNQNILIESVARHNEFQNGIINDKTVALMEQDVKNIKSDLKGLQARVRNSQ